VPALENESIKIDVCLWLQHFEIDLSSDDFLADRMTDSGRVLPDCRATNSSGWRMAPVLTHRRGR
jgi:hypothetical protein